MLAGDFCVVPLQMRHVLVLRTVKACLPTAQVGGPCACGVCVMLRQAQLLQMCCCLLAWAGGLNAAAAAAATAEVYDRHVAQSAAACSCT